MAPSKTTSKILYPVFGSTSPFYLKASIAILHILSVYFVLHASIPNLTSTSTPSSTPSSTPTSTPSSTATSTPIPPKEASSDSSSWMDDTAKVVDSMSETILDTIMYVPGIVLQSMGVDEHTRQKTPNEPEKSGSTRSDQDADANASSFEHAQSSDKNWWIQTWKSMHMHAIMHYVVGQHGFIYLPVWCCIFSLFSAAIPSMASFTKYREDVVAVVLPTMLFMCTAAHLCALWVVHFRQNANFHKEQWAHIFLACPLLTGSAFILHVCTHAMFHGMKTYMDMASRVRQVTSGSMVFLPVASVGFATIYWFAACTPAVLYRMPTSIKDLKDLIVVHALTAFLPECLGILFNAILKLLQRVVDNSNYDSYM